MRPMRIAVLVSGGGSNLQAILDAIDRGEINGEVVQILCSAKKAYALERARKYQIPAVVVHRKDYPDMEACNEARFQAVLAAEPDLIVLAGYLGIVPPQMVKRFRGRIINIHPALLPAYGGRGMFGHHVHEAVVAAGETTSGCTVHFVDEGTDTGPIIFQQAVPVLPGDTADTLAERILPYEHQLLPKAVALFCRGELRMEDGRAVIEPKAWNKA